MINKIDKPLQNLKHENNIQIVELNFKYIFTYFHESL